MLSNVVLPKNRQASVFTLDWDVKNQLLAENFALLSTPLIADAAVRLKFPLRIAPPGISPLIPGRHLAGCVRPAKHFGSVDVFWKPCKMLNPVTSW